MSKIISFVKANQKNIRTIIYSEKGSNLIKRKTLQ